MSESSAAAATSSSSSSSKKKRWFPLESNPALINSYIEKLGYDTSLYEFVDVFSTEDWALDMIAQPVAAVLMLYPLTKQQTSNTADDVIATAAMQDKVWFTKQRIGNACGTIGLLHALLNLPEALKLIQKDSWLEHYSNDCPIPLDPFAKAERLEVDSKIEKMHDEATSSETNATDRGSANEEVLTHFIALVCVDNTLYELDGRKKGPIDHGPTTQATLLQDAIVVVKKFMAKDPNEMRFTMTALAPK
jgi:ubiquitin carboxyl-terminal hydrolase L3